jgi:hypothetical protein
MEFRTAPKNFLIKMIKMNALKMLPFTLSSALFFCGNSSGNAECGNGAARSRIILVEPDPQRQVALAITSYIQSLKNSIVLYETLPNFFKYIFTTKSYSMCEKQNI